MKPLSDHRILIVDDARTNVDILVAALRPDYKISVALSGEAALKLVARTPPDLILLDIMMPGMDGYEVCRRLRADDATRDLPIVFLSALDEVKDKARGFELGAQDYVTKPFDVLEVKVRVKALIQAKAYRDALEEAMAAELRIATEIQLGMVPTEFSEACEGAPISIAAMLEPAREVGGDLYHAFRVGKRKLCIVLGDVSGKGVPAALFMAMTTTLVKSTARHIQSPGEILRRVNEELGAENAACMFVTLLVAMLDLDSGRLTWANGGHCSPALVLAEGAAGERVRLLEEPIDPLIGIEPELEFEEATVTLEPGQTFLLYSDGVTEAFDPERRLFEESGLIASLERSAGQSPEALIQTLRSDIAAHAAGAPQSDDIALLALRWEGSC